MHRRSGEKNLKRSHAARNRCQQCCDHCRNSHRKCDGQDPCSSCTRSRVDCTRTRNGSGGQEMPRAQELGVYDANDFTHRYGQHFFVKHWGGYLVVFAKGADCYVAYLNEHYQTISGHCYIGPKRFALDYSRDFTVDELLNVDTTRIDALFIKAEPPADYPSPSSEYTSSSSSAGSPSPQNATLIDYSRERLHSGSEVYRGGIRPPG